MTSIVKEGSGSAKISHAYTIEIDLDLLLRCVWFKLLTIEPEISVRPRVLRL
jgi:hypothetical protein